MSQEIDDLIISIKEEKDVFSKANQIANVLKEKNLGTRTVGRRISALRSFFKFLTRDEQMRVGIHLENDIEEVASVVTPSPLAEELPPATVQLPRATHEVNEDQQMTLTFDPSQQAKLAFDVTGDAPTCGTCGGIMVRSGTCHKCLICGTTSGCS